jgi:hypothetical protein
LTGAGWPGNCFHSREHLVMRTIQIALSDPETASALRDEIRRSGSWHVEVAPTPDLRGSSVIVVDTAALGPVLRLLACPERIVLIAPKGADLSEAWDAGIVSVVSEGDPVSTVMLAVIAASLRAENAARHRGDKREISQTAGAKLRQ